MISNVENVSMSWRHNDDEIAIVNNECVFNMQYIWFNHFSAEQERFKTNACKPWNWISMYNDNNYDHDEGVS